MEARGPVDAVDVAEAEGRVAERRRLLGEPLGWRRRLEEAEGALDVKLDV
jgi:hypothetical protein